MAVHRKLLVTGANGFVAGSILANASRGVEIHALSRSAPPAGIPGLPWHSQDFRDAAGLSQLFRQLKPDAVIHTAALADIDFCQSNPAAAREVNVEFTRRLAECCSESGSRLIFCSTDTVFDGEHAPYDESAAPGPVNLYAETKVAAEGIVASLGNQAVIARLALVVGLPVLGAGNSFLAKMRLSFQENRTVAVPAREVRTPVDVITLGRALLELATADHHGIFHLAGCERLSRFTMAQRIARRFGYSEQLVVDQPPAPGRAPRPRDVSLANAKACATLKTPMRTFDEALDLILEVADRSTK